MRKPSEAHKNIQVYQLESGQNWGKEHQE